MKVLYIPTGGIGLDGITMSILNYYKYFNIDRISTTFLVTKIKCDKTLFDKIIKLIQNNNDKIIYLNRRNIFKYFFYLIKILKAEKYDLVHIHGSSSLMSIELIAAKIAGIKVRIVHSHNTTCYHKVLNKLLKPVMKKFLTEAVACGKEAGQWLFDKDEFLIIKNGIELDKYRNDDTIKKRLKKELNIEDKIIIGNVGSFNQQKNHKFLIDIFLELHNLRKDVVLLLIGEGELKSEIEKYANKYNLKENVIFLGQRTDVIELYKIMDFFIMTSLYEGFPVVAIESQAANIPTLLSDRITKDIKITKCVEFESLNKEPIIWASKINLMLENIENFKDDDGLNKLTMSGFDSFENSKNLIEFYTECIRKHSELKIRKDKR